MPGPVQSRDASASPSDAELVSAARVSDGLATSHPFGALVARYEPTVFALAMSLVGEPTDASDVVQETFLRAFRNLDLLSDPSKFGVWLRRIAFGVSIDHVRAEGARVDGGRGRSAPSAAEARHAARQLTGGSRHGS